MEPTTFRIACEAYDRLAGSEDWDAFGQVFDRVLDGLSPADQDLVGRLIQQLKLGRANRATVTPRSTGSTEKASSPRPLRLAEDSTGLRGVSGIQ